MAQVNVAVELPAEQAKVWSVIADPRRFEEWLTIHDGWRGDIPAEIAVGTTMTELVKVMGMVNKISWNVDAYQAPASLTISGTGMAGVRVSFTLSVRPSETGSMASIDAEFTGQLVVGAIGAAVEKNSRQELEKSLAQLAELVA